jgi:lipopolysaccharide exporter
MIKKMRTVIASKLIEGSFARNVVTLVTGTFLAQILQLLIMPILTRLYSPEHFGVFSIYVSLIEIITVVACLRYEAAIVLADNDEIAANLFVLCVIILAGAVSATLLIVLFFRAAIAELLGSPGLVPYLWFLPLSIIAAGLYLPLSYWSIRHKQFNRLAVRQVTGSSATMIAQLAAGLALTPRAGGLIFGSICGQMIATGQLAWKISKETGQQIWSLITRYRLREVANRYRRFPLFDSWAAILNSVSYSVPVFLLAYYFNPAVVGFYALGARVLSIPGNLISQAVHQAFFQQAVENHRSGQLGSITLAVFRRLLNISLVPMALITIVAPDLFAIIFGTHWSIAGEYLRWLSLAVFFKFICSPISSIYDVLEKQNRYLSFNIILLIIRTSGLVIGGIHRDPLLAIILFGLGSAAMTFYLNLAIMHMAGISILKVLKVLGSELLASVPYAALPIGVVILSHNASLFVVAAIFSGLVFVTISLKKLSNTKVNESS